jgi:hypothetical protein
VVTIVRINSSLLIVAVAFKIPTGSQMPVILGKRAGPFVGVVLAKRFARMITVEFELRTIMPVEPTVPIVASAGIPNRL